MSTPTSDLPPYTSPDQQLILRDMLALDRTRLANERTLLAWLRTALMLLVSGVSLIKLFHEVEALQILGFALVPLSILVAGLGVIRYFKTARLIRAAIGS